MLLSMTWKIRGHGYDGVILLILGYLPLAAIGGHLHDDVIKWKHIPRHWPLCGEFPGDRWIPLTKASDAELWLFLWSTPEQTIE